MWMLLMLVLAVMCQPLSRPETAPEGTYTYFLLCDCLTSCLPLGRSQRWGASASGSLSSSLSLASPPSDFSLDPLSRILIG
uniref:Uncharacterized protein n=1 Tax=Chromera velia CCMP2878 TaxID=1169474 RepID=A0A0G4IBH6_9ALVE|eukprot:Cvel_12765.t1-p1 / transcript=Cvel_12765.t1 / gene=Cvel_12765 / organism=Chromera_velia_CCMP2878 / gene_product=hypothetical protein / transcript_product=hypothetical protein / location=Cvel_scaffold849:28933-34348(-) / protein_length=80 / sequence_SO=supercontig / SO=protein_coding / is_pseudo=false